MIIYNETWLSNLRRLHAVEQDYQDGLVPEIEWHAVQKASEHGFYSPNVFMRVGLFALTIITSVFSSGLLTAIVLSNGGIDNFGWPLLLAIVHYLALEYQVRVNHHYRSGVDDALLWISAGLLCTSFVMATDAEGFGLACFVFLLAGILSLRFTDAVMSAVCYLAFLAMVFFGWQKIGSLGNATMPFIMMLVSAGVYRLIRLKLDSVETRFYTHCMLVLQVASLLSLYAAGNYFVVKELNGMLNGTVSKSIPLGWFFWAWTVTMPLLYIYGGLKQKNAILLRSGLLLIAAAAATYKAYYRLMPVEYTLVLCGVAALLIAYLVNRYLSTPRNGFTRKQLRKDYLMEELQIESLIVSESFSETAVPLEENGREFGGGQFGGGGSGGGF